MKKILILLALITAATAAFAQSVEKDVELLRSDLRTAKVAFLTENMALTDAESEKFWPIQREYQAELSKLEDQRIALITEYAAAFKTMTDQTASDFMSRAFKLQEQRTSLLKRYCGKVAKAVSPKVALRFAHAEGASAAIVDLKIRAELPVVR